MTAGKSAEVRRILDRYLLEVVEAYDLCPWATSSRLGDEVAVEIVWGTAPSMEAWCAAAHAAMDRPNTRVAMIVAPELVIEREAFRATRDAVAASVPTAGVAHFHPDAPLDLVSPARLVPFVRRSPDPLLQLVPLSLLRSVRNTPTTAERLQQAQILGGHVQPPREEVSARIARVNHATVTAHLAAIEAKLAEIAADRAAAYARHGMQCVALTENVSK